MRAIGLRESVGGFLTHFSDYKSPPRVDKDVMPLLRNLYEAFFATRRHSYPSEDRSLCLTRNAQIAASRATEGES